MNIYNALLSLSLFLSVGLLFGMPAEARAVRVVGSSTVFPFASPVAEVFGKTNSFLSPVVEATGTGGGFKIFCRKDLVNSADIVNASRRVKLSEMKLCAKNGIQMTEFMFGKGGIVLVNSKSALPLSLSEELIFVALAKDNGFGEKPDTWASVGELLKSETALPDVPIKVYGPPPTSGTRDSFVELIMEVGAKKLSRRLAWDIDKKTFEIKSKRIREDGAFVEIGENDALSIRKILTYPGALAIFDFSFLEVNHDRIQGVKINGFQPTFENVASGDYPLSRPLFFYVKKNYINHIPVIKAYIREFISKKAIGEDGYLIDKGLIPLTEEEFKIQFEKLKSFPVLTEDDL